MKPLQELIDLRARERDSERESVTLFRPERDFFIDNLLDRIHLIV